MIKNRNEILIYSIKKLSRRKSEKHLSKIINKTHIADLSSIFLNLHTTEQKKVFSMLDSVEKQGAFLSELEGNLFVDFIDTINIEQLVKIFETIPADDAADLIARLPENKSDSILNSMKKEGSEEVENLLLYKDDSAGGVMSTDFISIRENFTTKETIEIIQSEYSDVDVAFYIYVTNEYDHLVGVISLRQLVIEKPNIPIKDFMTTDLFFVKTDVDQEEVAKIVAKYDILAVPVIDDDRKLVGIVTVDDIIDIIKQEATEDILKMGGVVGTEEFIETQSIIKSTQRRFPWLFASCIGGILSFFIINHFQTSLAQYVFLAAFIPVIMGMGGNIGTQSSTIVVRGIAMGNIDINNIFSVVLKELSVGVLLGILYGILIAIVAQFNSPIKYFPFAVASSVLISMSIAAFVGAFIPMFFARINVDPAIATGPFVTTSIDIISVFFYFSIASFFLGI